MLDIVNLDRSETKARDLRAAFVPKPYSGFLTLDQPITLRENKSKTTHKYCQPYVQRT
ncbi:hypothetical protein FB440_104107 [Vibrio crassostreae]|nr:hypothetical protein FB440_104107 [Vibrio crassostreae]